MMKKLLFICFFASYGICTAGITVQLLTDPVPCYEMAVLSCHSTETISNPFTSKTLTAQFSGPDGSPFSVEGFYNGNMTWLLRFMPNKPGVWSYTWQFNGQNGAGSFTCVTKRNNKLHGHLRIDINNPHKIRHDDGTPLHWIGGKYLDFDDPFYLTAERASVPERYAKSKYLPLVRTYLEAIAARGLNGIVLKMRVLPLNYDLKSMDLDFLATADQIMAWCMELGINVQLNFFDTWGKRKSGADISISNPAVTDLLLEPHFANTYVEETRFFIRYLIARYAAYPVTVWELWNEAERMKTEAKTASQLYVTYFQAYDPYRLPISASEIHAGGYPIQITSLHAGWKCGPSDWNWTHAITHNPPLYNKYAGFYNFGYANNRPILWNECYPNDGVDTNGFLYATNTAVHNWFRATFWGNLTAGCIGTSEFCWARIDEVPNIVTDYHHYFANFVNQLKDVNLLDWADAEVETNQGTATMCRYYGKEYVIYCFTQASNSQPTLQIKLPPGNYYLDYYNPRNGSLIGTRTLLNQTYSGWRAVQPPSFSQDIVLYLVEQSYLQTVVPVELAYFELAQKEGIVTLRWRTESETNNYGFAVERAMASDSLFHQIGFVMGHGTTQMPRAYAYQDVPPPAVRLKYRLRQIDHDGTFSLSPEQETIVTAMQPHAFQVSLYPNPAQETIQLQVALTHPEQVRFTIHNILQQTVYESDWSALPAGVHVLRWERKNLLGARAPSGVYFFTVQPRTQTIRQTGKFLLLR